MTFFFINKHSDMPVSALSSCCAMSGLAIVWVTLAGPVVLQCPGLPLQCSWLSRACPVTRRDVGRVPQTLKGPEGRMSPACLAQTRAGHSCPADARGLLWGGTAPPDWSQLCWCLSVQGQGSWAFLAAALKKGVTPHKTLILYGIFAMCQH